jgi:L-fuconate dehydratase
MTEYVDHLHEHFVDPCVVWRGRYQVPAAPGTSITMKLESLDRYAYPSGEAWRRNRPLEP